MDATWTKAPTPQQLISPAGSSYTLSRDESIHAQQLTFAKRGWQYASIRPIATRVAKQTLKAVRKPSGRGGKTLDAWERSRLPERVKQVRFPELESLTSHPLLDVVANPNALMVQWQLMWSLVFSLQATGKAYWWFTQTKGKLQVWPVPASWVTVDNTKSVRGSWLIKPDGHSGEPFRVPGEEIAFFYMPDPNDPLSAMSSLAAAARPILSDDAIHEAQYQGFQAGHMPDHAFIIGERVDPDGHKRRPELSETQRKELDARLRQMFGGPRKHGRHILLDNLITDVRKLSMAPDEMAYKDSMKATEREIEKIFGVNPIMLGEIESANRACHDTDTQLLTRRGWRNYDELSEGDVAGTMNPETGHFEWQKISRVHVYNDFSGDMVRVSGCKVDACVTPEHRMWRTKHTQDQTIKGAPRPVRKNLPWGFVKADELACHDVLPIACAPHKQDVVEWFDIPGDVNNRGNGSQLPSLRVPMSGFLGFLGWWVSEGWTAPDKPYKSKGSKYARKNYAICIKQVVSATKECGLIDEAAASLTGISVSRSRRAGVPATETQDGYARKPTYTWGMTNKSLWRWLRTNCGSAACNKRLPEFVFDLSGSQLNLLLDAMLLGDGHHRTDDLATYFTVSPELADQVQTLALLCGRSARIGTRMKSGVIPVTVMARTSRAALLPKHITREVYTGPVWCVTVPNGLIVTRRNGKPLVSGNSATVADSIFLSNVANPLLELVGQVLTAFVRECPFFHGQQDVVVYFDEIVAADPELELKEWQFAADRGMVDIDDYRVNRLGLPPLPNGTGKIARINITMIDVPVGKPRTPEAESTTVVPPIPERSFKSLTDQTWKRQHDIYEAKIAAALEGLFQRQASEFEQQILNGVMDAATIASTENWSDAIKSVVRPLLREAAVSGASLELELMKSQVVRHMKADDLDDRLFGNAGNVLYGIDDYLDKLFKQAYWFDIGDGIEDELDQLLRKFQSEGMSSENIARNIVEKFEHLSVPRAQRIARTETTGSQNAGSHFARIELAETGLVTGKEWNAILDKETRGMDPQDAFSHVLMDGQRVGVKEDFNVGGEMAPFPGHYSLSAANRIACRCFTSSVLLID